MDRHMLSLAEAASAIAAGKRLLLAGDESLLTALPKGDWIGGTIPYFMADAGGEHTKARLFATELPGFVQHLGQRLYPADAIAQVSAEAPVYGVSFLILPAGSTAHRMFAEVAPTLPDQALKPMVGWVAGVALEDLGKVTPKVFDGRSGTSSADAAAVMHVGVPRSKSVRIDIVNLFTQGDGDELQFEETGFKAAQVLVGGRRVGFADYLKQRHADLRLPLVADSYGAMINTSFQAVDEATSVVQFYAPVFKGTTYKLARPVGDYSSEFARAVPGSDFEPAFSCNCILNYLYGGLEGRKTAAMKGPITFGEIAYQLLNQTLVFLDFV